MSSLQVVYKRSLCRREGLTLGKTYDVLDMEEISESNSLGVTLPLSMNFTIKDDNGDNTTLRMCNVDVLIDGKPL